MLASTKSYASLVAFIAGYPAPSAVPADLLFTATSPLLTTSARLTAGNTQLQIYFYFIFLSEKGPGELSKPIKMIFLRLTLPPKYG